MRVGIPLEVQEICMDITLLLYIMFEIKFSFVVKILSNLKFMTSEFVPNRMQYFIFSAMKKIKVIYPRRLFWIIYCGANNTV